MHKKFEINRTNIKGGCQSGRKVVTQDSKSDLPLNTYYFGPNNEIVLNKKCAKMQFRMTVPFSIRLDFVGNSISPTTIFA